MSTGSIYKGVMYFVLIVAFSSSTLTAAVILFLYEDYKKMIATLIVYGIVMLINKIINKIKVSGA